MIFLLRHKRRRKIMSQRQRSETCKEIIVYMTARDDGTVGYFESKTDIPEGWDTEHVSTRDISDVMESLRATKEQALRTMNAHWRF